MMQIIILLSLELKIKNQDMQKLKNLIYLIKNENLINKMIRSLII